jgi:hypothetical protein
VFPSLSIKEQLKYLFISLGTLTCENICRPEKVDSREHYSILYIQSDYVVIKKKFLSSE